MIIHNYEDLDRLYAFYLAYTKAKTNYLVLDFDLFQEKLIKDRIWLVSAEKDRIDGFLSASLKDKTAYLSLVYGDEPVACSLLEALENRLQAAAIQDIRVHFRNPVSLPWEPKNGFMHPGMPGVDVDSTLYLQLDRLGYLTETLQEVYYLDLSEYKEHCLELSDSEIRITLYDRSRHRGFEAFLDALEAKTWQKVLSENENSSDPLPLVVVLDQDRVVGFAGPMAADKVKRGYFAGIGILEAYRGRSIGKHLFNNLCFYLKTMGAGYMTLFTGTTNIARHIYLEAGFVTTGKYATMRKELRKRG